ncbi:histidinol-phosphate transaminase [Actinomyces bowdenii]|uniref:histidinol-phosphate transaminase n=1 Tax=Actinomyces bowdenii TaxID=131109 RepID=UPI001ABCE98B|nr:histidinol-phosphate transaminase [Actinomyces bowdenii]MBO3724065.1 histidinol-phosphate transaminase [Actinomyces bowdenii]
MSTVSARRAESPAGPESPERAAGPARPTTTVRIRPDLADLPAYVPGSRAWGAQAVKLSSNELPHPPQEAVVEAIAGAAREVNRYPEMTGAGLVAALAEHWGVTPDQVVVGNGSVALIQHLLDTVCEPGDEVVLPWRSFEAYPICVAVAGARAIRVPLDPRARHDIPAMLAAITPRTRMVIACSPNNPTGTVLSAADLAALVEGVPRDVVVLVDEAYLDFVTDPGAGRALPLLASHPNLVIARTFSKAHALAGLRVGCLIAEPGLACAVRSVCTPFGVSLPAQAAALAALGEAALAETARRCRGIAVERDRLAGVLRDQGWQVPQAQGNFLWLPAGREAGALAEHFAQAGLLVRPFAGEGVRVSVGLPADNERVAAAAAAWMGAGGSAGGSSSGA